MKHIIFTIETAYSVENYFLEVNENDSIELQIDDALAEICFCDAYEIVSYKEVDDDYYIKRLAVKTAYDAASNAQNTANAPPSIGTRKYSITHTC